MTLDDSSIDLVVSAAIPDERAQLRTRVMRQGKDFMPDKPGITTLDQLAEVRRVQAETMRIYSVACSERLENRATVESESSSVWCYRPRAADCRARAPNLPLPSPSVTRRGMRFGQVPPDL